MAKQGMKNPATVAAKWATNLSASTTSIQAGVQAVTTSPTSLAARQADAYLSGVQQAVASGKWQNSLNAVSLSSWQNSMITKGIPRIQSGATAGKSNVQNFMTQFLPFVQNAQQTLAATPRGNLQQNIQRMVTWANQMSQFQYTKTGS